MWGPRWACAQRMALRYGENRLMGTYGKWLVRRDSIRIGLCLCAARLIVTEATPLRLLESREEYCQPTTPGE